MLCPVRFNSTLGYMIPILTNSMPYAASHNHGQKEQKGRKKYVTPQPAKRVSGSAFAQKLFVDRHPVDTLLGEFERCKENGINDA